MVPPVPADWTPVRPTVAYELPVIALTFLRLSLVTTPPLFSNSDLSKGWNFADVWEFHAARFPDAPAQEQGDRLYTWGEMNTRANGIANTLLQRGAKRQDKVAQYLHNCPEYMESMFALYKVSLVPVNTNYRYTDDELLYLWDNSDAVAVIFHAAYTDRCQALRDRCPNIKAWIWVNDGTTQCPDWAIDYEVAAMSHPQNIVAPWKRSGDDYFFLYTGGTTGMPKAVMWRQDDVFCALDIPSRHPLPAKPNYELLAKRCSKPGPKNLPGAPLMHGTGAFNAIWVMCLAGVIVTLEGRGFSAVELLDTVHRHRINSLTIVGDAFGRPIVDALDGEPNRWDISSLRFIFSSGAMWSAENKAGFLRHNDHIIIIDSLGSSEALGMAAATTSATDAIETARFKLSKNTRIVTEQGNDVVPGSGERGRVAIRGRTPVGYYKDEAKSAATFIVIDDIRYSIPGDWAEVDADGTVKLLGRGSQCINTGGEKVYPEEVEEVLKQHAMVADAAVIGVPHERFGESIIALVQLKPGKSVEENELTDHVKKHLAAYKAPRAILYVDSVDRAANGKLDYRALTDTALSRLS